MILDVKCDHKGFSRLITCEPKLVPQTQFGPRGSGGNSFFPCWGTNQKNGAPGVAVARRLFFFFFSAAPRGSTLGNTLTPWRHALYPKPPRQAPQRPRPIGQEKFRSHIGKNWKNGVFSLLSLLSGQ